MADGHPPKSTVVKTCGAGPNGSTSPDRNGQVDNWRSIDARSDPEAAYPGPANSKPSFPRPCDNRKPFGQPVPYDRLKMASLIALLQSVPRMEPPQGVYPTTKHEAIAVLRMLLQDAATHKPQTDPPHIDPIETTRPCTRRAVAAGRGANRQKSALTSAVNMSVSGALSRQQNRHQPTAANFGLPDQKTKYRSQATALCKAILCRAR